MYHIFFIHSPVDGHLGCFHDLPIVNSAAVQSSDFVLLLQYCVGCYVTLLGLPWQNTTDWVA